MGCTRQYVYKLVNEGKLSASRISSRMAFIRKADIEQMLAGNPYHRVLPTTKPKKSSSSLSSKKGRNHIPETNTQPSEPLDYISGEDVMLLSKSRLRHILLKQYDPLKSLKSPAITTPIDPVRSVSRTLRILSAS